MNSKATTTIAIAVMLTAAALVIPVSMASVGYAKDTCGEDVKEINIKIVNPKAGAGSVIGPFNICPNVDTAGINAKINAVNATASNAKTLAEQAKSTAESASNTADAANTAASGAQTTANAASATANQALNATDGLNTRVAAAETNIVDTNKRIDNLTTIEACVVHADGSTEGVCPPAGGGTGGNNTGNGTTGGSGNGTGTGTGGNGTGTGTGTGGNSTSGNGTSSGNGTGTGTGGNGTTGNGTVVINGTGPGPSNGTVIVNESGGFIPQLLAGIAQLLHIS